MNKIREEHKTSLEVMGCFSSCFLCMIFHCWAAFYPRPSTSNIPSPFPTQSSDDISYTSFLIKWGSMSLTVFLTSKLYVNSTNQRRIMDHHYSGDANCQLGRPPFLSDFDILSSSTPLHVFRDEFNVAYYYIG